MDPIISQHESPSNTARRIARAVVGIIVVAFIAFGSVRWFKTMTPRINSSLSTLHEDVAFVVVLYPSKRSQEQVNPFYEAFHLDSKHKTIVFMKNGEILSVPTESRGAYIPRTKRPLFWFLPKTSGALYQDQQGKTIAKRLTLTRKGITVQQKTDINPIHSLIPTGLTLAARINTEGMHEQSLPNSIVTPNITGEFDAFYRPDGSALFSFGPEVPVDSVHAFASESIKWRIPDKTARLLPDGLLYHERTTAKHATNETYQLGGFEVTTYGDSQTQWSIVHLEDFTYLSSTIDFLEEAILNMSTQSWTSTYCGVEPISLITFDSSPKLANDISNDVALVQFSRGWRLCTIPHMSPVTVDNLMISG